MRPIEVRNKIREGCKKSGCGKWMLGRKLSEKHKTNISLGNLGRLVSKETRNKLRIINTGKIMSFKSKEKMRISKLGKKHPHSPEHIKNQSGENHYNWQGGKTLELYPLGWNITYKEQIRFRDGYKCQLCGCSEVENRRKLSVHHIDYDKNNIKSENLIVLCLKCHAKTNYNKNYWLNYFTKSLISSLI